jgi:hypothetical protein
LIAEHPLASAVRCEPLASSGVLSALELLLEGYVFAQDLQTSPWEFALDQSALVHAGCTPNALNWLCRRGYVERREPRQVDPRRPRAARSARRSASAPTYILTAKGAEIARDRELGSPTLSKPAPSGRRIPAWDGLRGELWFAGQLVRRFRNAASNQRVVLAAFQVQEWPDLLPDPLPPLADCVHVKQRLHDTIKNLNRCHLVACIRFFGTGAGRLVGWKRDRG